MNQQMNGEMRQGQPEEQKQNGAPNNANMPMLPSMRSLGLQR